MAMDSVSRWLSAPSWFLENTSSHSLRTASLYFSPILLVALIRYISSPRRSLPPGPRGLPLIGNAHQITGKLWLTLEKWNKEYGPVVYLNLLGQDMIVLGTHQAAADLLDRRAAIYSDRPRNVVTSILNGDLNFAFVGDDDKWKRHRRAAHDATSIQAARQYAPFQEAESVILVEQLLRSPETHDSHIRRAGTSMLMSIMYGRPPVQDSSDPVIQRVISNANRTLSASMPGAFMVEYFPWMMHLPKWMCSWRRWAEEWHRRDSVLFEGLHCEVVARMSEGAQKPSVLTNIIQEQKKLGLSDREVAWLCSALNSAGSETMSGQMSWFLVAIILHPDVQSRAQEELDHVVGRDRMPLLSDYDHLPYLNAVLKELLRWRSVGPLGFPHQSRQDDYYNGHFIPKGTSCLVNAWAMNHDTAVYGADADQFRPERFLTGDGTLAPMPPDTKEEGHVTYGFGRRICVGRHISNYSMFMWMASILWACRISPGKDASGISKLPDAEAVIDGAFAVRPAPFLCSMTTRFAEVEGIITETKERYGSFLDMKSLFALSALLLVAVTSDAATVTFSREKGCNTVSQTYRGNCNFCADPPGDWSSIRFSDISGNHRVTTHNQDRCTPASQVGQGYGPACWNQGRTKLRSAWVACPGQRRLANGTIVNEADVDEAEVA